MGRFLNILAAVSSISIFGILVWWGVTLSQLDPNDIPVIRKVNGPARISPDEPGGKQADHQGLSVNEVQSVNGVSKAVDKVYLAPKPRPFQAEDIAGLNREKPSDLNMKIGQVPILKSQNISPEIKFSSEQVNPEQSKFEENDSDDLDVKITSKILIEKNPLIKNRSMVPQIRPKKLEIISTNSLSQNVIAELGKFDNDAVATVQLQNIKKVYSNLLLDKDLLIEEENDGSNIIYILRVESFENINDVENFCFEIRKQGTVCTPVFK